MSALTLHKQNSKGKLGILISNDGTHAYVAVQAPNWPKPVHRPFVVGSPDYLRLCDALGTAHPFRPSKGN